MKRPMINKPKKMGVIYKRRIYIEKTTKMVTIANIPLNEDGRPMFDKLRVEDERKVFKGYHTYTLAILLDRRKEIIQREIVS